MDGYLSKPIDPALLFATVEQTESGAGGDAPALRSVSAAIDRDALLNRVGGDVELFAEIVRLFLADCPARVADIQAAVAAGDGDAIRLTCHALKGAAGNLSAMDLMAAARALERIGAEGRIEAAPAAFRELTTQAALAIDSLRQMVPVTAVSA